jgi:hypothetical protein
MKLWRVVLLLVLTLVLPVRGALAVSMGMAVEAPIGMAHSAAPANADVPCPHHAQPTDHALAAPSDHNDDHHSAHTHLLCDVCNVLALNVPIPVAKRADTRPVHAAQGNERFSSVVPPIGHKPPIPV